MCRGGETVYPAWQLTFDDGPAGRAVVDPAWLAVQGPLVEAGWSPEEVLLWAASPSGRLEDSARPVDRIREDVAAVVDAARTVALGPSG
jgi:hypothetical protein